ncbi:pilus assembly protein PilM [Cardiobacteriaceae bacterium TAE3-ERU3]|nr:pilus assembly protein PilM [Cardiobacteriaceae bacterium TAE3-ERU3]
MLGSSNTMLAVDIGQFSVKSVQGKFKSNIKFTGKNGNYVLRQKSQIQNEEQENDVHHSLVPLSSKKSDIFTAVALSDVITREIEIGREISAFERESAIEVELSELLPFSLDQVYFDFKEIESDGEETSGIRYLVATSRRDIVDPLTDSIFSFEKFDRKRNQINVDVDAYALGRLINSIYSEEVQDGTVLLIDIAHERSRYYFYSSKGLIFNREQQIGGKYATESIAEIYDLNFEDAQLLKHRDEHDSEFIELVVKPFAAAFAEQLNLVIDFFEASGKADKDITKVVLIGGGACLNSFIDELQSLISLVVEMIDLSIVWSGGNPENQDWKTLSANYALAISLLTDGDQ